MLATEVWPAMLSTLTTIVGADPSAAISGDMPRIGLKGLSEGEQDSVPETPWCWMLNDGASMPLELGSDLTVTNWRFKVRLLTDWSNDKVNAERVLMPLVEQVRQLFQAHIKLGTATIVLAMVTGMDWGYTPVNEIWYRTCDLEVSVKEKEIRNYNA